MTFEPDLRGNSLTARVDAGIPDRGKGRLRGQLGPALKGLRMPSQGAREVRQEPGREY